MDIEIARGVLRDIAKNGRLEYARVRAAKVLATMATGDKAEHAAIGKKEQAVAKAKKLVAGKFAPRKPKLVVNNHAVDHS